MAKMLLRYVEEFIDRHGKPHRYFRRAGKRVRLPGLPGSAEFMGAYQAALDGVTLPKPEITAPRTAPGTVHWLVSAYLSSATFKASRPRRNALAQTFSKTSGRRTATSGFTTE